MSLLKYFTKLPPKAAGPGSPGPCSAGTASSGQKRSLSESSFNAASPPSVRACKRPQPAVPSASATDAATTLVAYADAENASQNGVSHHLPPTTSCLKQPQHLQLEAEVMAPDWFATFRKEMEKPYFVKIKDFLALENRKRQVIYPSAQDLYSFTKCPLKKIKVVILGQDPYHGVNQAHGLCFSVKKGVPPPPSLVNIFKELQSDLGSDKFTIPPHGFLDGWAEQGVLLLNAALTVRAGQATSHSGIGWAEFTDAIVGHVNQNMRNVVFMLWGAHAQKKGSKIDREKHLVLRAVHPSPLSAHRGFFGCKHFSQANDYLVAHGKQPIDWNKL